MERYKGPSNGSGPQQGQQHQYDPPDIETKLCRDTGLQHPYNREKDDLSKYPMGFRGCFACGKEDHRSGHECPLSGTSQFDKKTFFLEMWTHKPHTKRPALPVYHTIGHDN